MTKRAASIQGGLAAVGLLIAYLTWQREPEHPPGAVTVIDAGKLDVTRLHYDDEHNSFELQRAPGSSQAELALHLVVKDNPAPKKPPAKPSEAKPEAPPPPRDLVGGEPAAKLWEEFTPLVSPRAFGVLDAAKLKELGLDAPTRKLEVTVKGEVRRYVIGQPEKATGGEAFLRDTGDGRVYLLPRGMLPDLQNPAHLVDRRLHLFDPDEFDRMVLSSGGKQKEFVQVDRDQKAKTTFAAAKTPDKHDQMVKNWHDALWRVFPSEILGRGEEPPAGKPVPVLRVDYYDGKHPVGFLEFARPEAAGAVSEEAPDTEVYVRTEHSAGWIKVHTGGQLIADAQKLIAAP